MWPVGAREGPSKVAVNVAQRFHFVGFVVAVVVVVVDHVVQLFALCWAWANTPFVRSDCHNNARTRTHIHTHNRPNDVSPREKKRNLLFVPAAGSIRHGWLLRFCYELLRYTHCLFAECICLERFIFHFLSLLFLRSVRCCCCWDRFYCHDPRATASQYEERLDIYRSPSSCRAPVWTKINSKVVSLMHFFFTMYKGQTQKVYHCGEQCLSRLRLYEEEYVRSTKQTVGRSLLFDAC